MKIKYLAFALFVISCAPTIKNFEAYQKQFLSKTNFMPSKENLEGKSPKIVVFALEENDNQVATQAQLGNSIANNIENVLAKNRLAELIDRKASGKLQKEISLAEMKKTGSYKGPQVADYAISGTISNAGFVSKYSRGSFYYSPRTGFINIPPSFTYSSDVSGNLKIYELPSLSVVEVIEFSGKKVRKENAQSGGGVNLGGIQIGGGEVSGTKRDDSLVRKAGEDAVDNIKIDIKNSFAKKGYILEKRVYDNKTIFKTNLGSLDGIKHGDKIEITGQYETENQITNETEIEKRLIAKGTITDKIDPKTSWFVIDDKDKTDLIRLGDSIKIKYKKGSFDDAAKIIKLAIDQ